MLHQQHLEEKRDSTRQCLRICAEVAKHMDQLHLSIQESIHPDTGQAITLVLEISSSARRVSSATIEKCKKRFVDTTCELKTHLHKVNSGLKSFARANNTVDEIRSSRASFFEFCLGAHAQLVFVFLPLELEGPFLHMCWSMIIQ